MKATRAGKISGLVKSIFCLSARCCGPDLDSLAGKTRQRGKLRIATPHTTKALRREASPAPVGKSQNFQLERFDRVVRYA
ncbi:MULTISPECIES: hypothetical protein [unclassified Microcoleus]|uniref:hypothetical protein n=1 Tax=unclassified Microcoleus TaxID=2642155 RepID=UPI002FD666CF